MVTKSRGPQGTLRGQEREGRGPWGQQARHRGLPRASLGTCHSCHFIEGRPELHDGEPGTRTPLECHNEITGLTAHNSAPPYCFPKFFSHGNPMLLSRTPLRAEHSTEYHLRNTFVEVKH